MFGGTIAIDPNHVNDIYYGTGVANDATDSYAGSGVYFSSNYGQTWTLLTDPVLGNPLAGAAISAIIMEGSLESIFVAASDEQVNTHDINGVDGTPANIPAASWAGNVATITANNTFSAGQTVIVSNVNNTAYIGSFTILSANSTSFTYAHAVGEQPSAGSGGNAIVPVSGVWWYDQALGKPTAESAGPFVTNGDVTSASNTITSIVANDIAVGDGISAPGIPNGTTIVSVTGAPTDTITISVNATAGTGAAEPLTITPAISTTGKYTSLYLTGNATNNHVLYTSVGTVTRDSRDERHLRNHVAPGE